MERTLLLDIFFDLVLLASAILENGLSVRFVDKLVFEGERVLSRRQKGWICAAVVMASLLEYLNKRMGFFYSLAILALQILIIETVIFIIRRKKLFSMTCVFVMFFSIIQTLELLMVIGISMKVLSDQHMLALYEGDSAYIRNIVLLMIRVLVWGVYRVIRMREVRVNHPLLLGGASILAYIDMYYLYKYAYFEINFVEISVFAMAIGILSLIVVGLIIGSLYYFQKEKGTEIEKKDIALESNYIRFYNIYSENEYLAHDMKNHLAILENYMRHKEYEKAYDYMAKLREPILQIEQYVHSGNRVIDMVLNDKLAAAQRENIKVNLEIDTIGEVEILGKDLCAVLSNLLDNAIESCQKSVNQEAWIDISVRKVTHGLIVKIANSAFEKVIVREGSYLTTKAEKDKHGIGLESVRYVLKKYNSNIKIEDKNNAFNVSIVFFL
mgnify:CR=1 FL=1